MIKISFNRSPFPPICRLFSIWFEWIDKFVLLALNGNQNKLIVDKIWIHCSWAQIFSFQIFWAFLWSVSRFPFNLSLCLRNLPKAFQPNYWPAAPKHYFNFALTFDQTEVRMEGRKEGRHKITRDQKQRRRRVAEVNADRKFSKNLPIMRKIPLNRV